jgi:hypothetical protein
MTTLLKRTDYAYHQRPPQIATHSVWYVEDQAADVLILAEHRIFKDSACRLDVVRLRFLYLKPNLSLRLCSAKSVRALKERQDWIKSRLIVL